MIMFRFIALVVLLVIAPICVLFSAVAQNSPDEQPNDKVTYVLLDVSGSMKGKGGQDLAFQRLEMVAGDQSQVSFSHFRAESWAACSAPVDIEAPEARVEVKRRSITYKDDDFSPLGSALKAAILVASSRQANAEILLISDAGQSQGCGPDICAVASAMLPISGIEVRSLAVTGSPKIDLDRLGCIDAAQNKNFSAADSGTAGTSVAIGGDQPIATWPERWAWLLIFLLVAVSAVILGLLDASKALIAENDTNTAHALRRRIEAKGDEGAKSEMKALITKYRPHISDTSDDVNLKKGTDAASIKDNLEKVALWAAKRFSPIGFWGGTTALLLLALLPSSWSVGDFNFGSAQLAAWTVLDSDFSTAFAGSWLALLYFMARQNQRNREAHRSAVLAVDDGEVAVEVRKSREQKQSFSKYEVVHAEVKIQQFNLPVSSLKFEEAESREAFMDKCSRVQTEAISMALRGAALTGTEELDQIIEETDRLRAYQRPTNFFGQPYNNSLIGFVGLLADNNALDGIPSEKEWRAVEDCSNANFKDAIETLASNLS